MNAYHYYRKEFHGISSITVMFVARYASCADVPSYGSNQEVDSEESHTENSTDFSISGSVAGSLGY